MDVKDNFPWVMSLHIEIYILEFCRNVFVSTMKLIPYDTVLYRKFFLQRLI